MMAIKVDWSRTALHVVSQDAMRVFTNDNHAHEDPGGFWKPPLDTEISSKKLEPVIPAPALFKSLEEEQHTPAESGLFAPTLGQCAVHLELLQAFYTLRTEILKSEELDLAFSIIPKKRSVSRRSWRGTTVLTLSDTTFPERRKVKWPIFVEIATVRFQDWLAEVEKDLVSADLKDSPILLQHLPPLDVLMVWHSCLLNPGRFNHICQKKKLSHVGNLCFPWPAIHEVIDAKNWSFHLKEEDGNWFWEKTGYDPDLYGYLKKFESSPPKIFQMMAENADFGMEIDLAIRIAQMTKQSFTHTNFLKCCARLALHGKTALTKELSAAVMRQASFVEKMYKHLWIRSPAVEGTIKRAQDRYSNFLQLFKLYPGTMLVPTIDIDLVWHTHQCSHGHYTEACKTIAGRFIDHDDKIGSATLDEGMNKTKELYQIQFGEEYDTCYCWDCEAVLSAIDELDYSKDETPDFDAMKIKVAEDIAYYKAVEAARRRNQSLPLRHM